jgi:hypothetical protein
MKFRTMKFAPITPVSLKPVSLKPVSPKPVPMQSGPMQLHGILLCASLLLLSVATSLGAQTYVKPYSLSLGMSEKFDRKLVGPAPKSSDYSFNNAASISLNYRTPQDKIRMGLSFSRTLQTGTNTVSAEVRYNVLQWGHRERPVRNPPHQDVAPVQESH